jgi:glyoxylase-like metal-dependent hydrolase (beta-lactamase superfamily II)
MITEIYPSLFLVREHNAPDTTQFTYFIRHSGGVLLFGTKADLSAHYAALRKFGPLTHILLGDRHHASAHTLQLAQHFGVPISASQGEASALKNVKVGNVLPFERTTIVPGLEAIPTPGHTGGAFSYLWTGESKNFLFVGDSIVPVNGRWEYWVTRKHRADMIASLNTLASLEFDVVLSNSFAATPRAWIETDSADQRAMFADLQSRLSD